MIQTDFVKLNNKDERFRFSTKLVCVIKPIIRVVLTPIFLLIRLYCWVWDYDYYEIFFKR